MTSKQIDFLTGLVCEDIGALAATARRWSDPVVSREEHHLDQISARADWGLTLESLEELAGALETRAVSTEQAKAIRSLGHALANARPALERLKFDAPSPSLVERLQARALPA